MQGHALQVFVVIQLCMALAFLVGSAKSFTFPLARHTGRRYTMSAAVEAAVASQQAAQWHQNQFTISMPADSACSSRVVTTAVHTRLEPLLEGIGAGIAHLQVLNETAYLSVGRADTVSDSGLLTGSRSLSLAVAAGELQLGHNQDLLLHSPPPTELSGSASIAGGSVRFAFLCTWVGGEAAPPLLPDTAAAATAATAAAAAGDSCTTSSNAAAASTEEQLAAELAEKTQGGHVVGQWRPMDEWSEEREAALVKALAGLGHDAEELRTSEEFFGSSALKVRDSLQLTAFVTAAITCEAVTWCFTFVHSSSS
jgi:hypothetical protein